MSEAAIPGRALRLPRGEIQKHLQGLGRHHGGGPAGPQRRDHASRQSAGGRRSRVQYASIARLAEIAGRAEIRFRRRQPWLSWSFRGIAEPHLVRQHGAGRKHHRMGIRAVDAVSWSAITGTAARAWTELAAIAG